MFRSKSDNLQASIHGYVIGSDPSGRPLEYVANAEVSFLVGSGVTVAEAKTDRNGYYLVENLPAKTLSYEVKARGYQDENAGRSIHVVPSLRPMVQDFSVVQGEAPRNSNAELVIGVWTKNPSGGEERIDDALVTVTPTANASQHRTEHTRSGKDCEFSVLPENEYTVAATHPDFMPKPDSEIDRVTVTKDGDNRLQVYLQPAVHVSVMVTVQGSINLGTVPQVFVRSADGSKPIPTRLTRLPKSGRGDSGNGPSQRYLANPIHSVAAGEYYATAALAGNEQSSNTRMLSRTDNTLYVELNLEPTSETFKLSGIVQRAAGNSPPTPFPGAKIVFTNDATGKVFTAFAATSGRYEIELPPGIWNADPSAPSGSPTQYLSDPKRLSISRSNQIQNFRLAQSNRELEIGMARAVAMIEVVDGGNQSGNYAPTVSFFDGSYYDAQAVTRLPKNQFAGRGIDRDSTSHWFVARQVVRAGLVKVDAKLGSEKDSQEEFAYSGQPRTFWLRLGATGTPANPDAMLIANVVEAADPTKYIEGAWIQIGSKTRTPTLGGVYGPVSIEEGNWQISAGAPGYISSEIQWHPVQLGKTLTLNFALRPAPATRPSYPATGLIHVVDKTGCGNPDSPSAKFVSEQSQQSVEAIVSLQSFESSSLMSNRGHGR